MRSSSNRANAGALSRAQVAPASSLRMTLGEDPAKSVFGSRYWIGREGSKAGATVGGTLVTAEALGGGAGVKLAGAVALREGVDVSVVHAMIRSAASETRRTVAWLTHPNVAPRAGRRV